MSDDILRFGLHFGPAFLCSYRARRLVRITPSNWIGLEAWAMYVTSIACDRGSVCDEAPIEFEDAM